MLFFCLHSRDSRGLSVADRLSVSMKFGNILQLENYIQVAHLEYQGRERQYFRLQFVEIEMMFRSMKISCLCEVKKKYEK